MVTSTYNPIQITLEISDKVIDSTILKRKANLFTMTYNQDNKSLVLNWVITHFAQNSDGTYGNTLKSIISDISHENIADNTTIVDQTTGSILPDNGDGTFGTIDQVVMGQYDWFNMMAETQQLPVHNMIRQYGASVNWDII